MGRSLLQAESPSGTILTRAELYDPSTGTWTETGSMSTSRYNQTATLFTAGPLAGQVLVAGGCGAVAPSLVPSYTTREPACGRLPVL